ncbi:MAG: hypothetical protein ACR2K2_07910 [Mycobacteriales bacterium]
MTALVVGLTVAVALLAVLVAGLLRSHAEILRSLHELGAGREDTAPQIGASRPVDVPFEVRPGVVGVGNAMGTPAHDVAGLTPGDEATLISIVASGHDTLLAFLSSGCLTCHTFWDAFGAGRDLGLPAGTRLVVVTRGRELESESSVRDLAPLGIPVVMSTQAWDDYGVPGSPYFVHVDGAAGRVAGEGSATAWEQVIRLVREAAQDRALLVRGDDHADDHGDGPHREERADRELLAAGIPPGHPSLYLTAADVTEPTGRD